MTQGSPTRIGTHRSKSKKLFAPLLSSRWAACELYPASQDFEGPIGEGQEGGGENKRAEEHEGQEAQASP